MGGGAKPIQPYRERGVMPLPILGIPKILTELALARVEVEAACSQEDQPLGVV